MPGGKPHEMKNIKNSSFADGGKVHLRTGLKNIKSIGNNGMHNQLFFEQEHHP
jgi:hypothetical protein